MTPEERAEEIKQEIFLRGDTVQIEVEFIAHHIREAIRDERERCAKIVEAVKPPIGMHGYNDEAIKHIAAAIRSNDTGG